MNKLLQDLKLFSTKIPQFFTTWSLFIFILTTLFSKYMPYFILLCSQNLIFTTSIFGYYILNKYGHNLLKLFTSLKLIYVDIFNYIFHVLPLLYIFVIKKEILVPRNYNDILYSILFSICIIYLYLKNINPTKIYWFTGYKKKLLISITMTLYILCFFIKK